MKIDEYKDINLILAAGMPRSASTWLYNVARILLSDISGTEFGCGWVEDLDKIPRKKCMLIKLHEYDQFMVENSDYIMYSYRDIRDTMASNFRKFGNAPSMKQADHLINQYEKWIKVADFVMRYESMLTDKSGVIKKLGKGFGLYQFDPEDIIKKVAAINYKNTDDNSRKYHSINLYHPGHITDGRHGSWHNVIDPGLTKNIEKKYGKWFLECGYPVI